MPSATFDERLKTASVDNGEITLSDTVPVTFADPEEGTTKYCRGFHCNIDGDLTVVFPQSSAAVRLVVKAGVFYPYAIKLFKSTGTTSGMKVVPLR